MVRCSSGPTPHHPHMRPKDFFGLNIKCPTAMKKRFVGLMMCMVVASVGAVKCEGASVCLLCLKLLVLTDHEFDIL